jgi:hypothetical protein
MRMLVIGISQCESPRSSLGAPSAGTAPLLPTAAEAHQGYRFPASRCKDSSYSLTSPPRSKRSRDRLRVPLHKRLLYSRATSYRFQPALQSIGLLRADRHVRHPMEGLRNQYLADLHDRLNIGIVRRVPLEFGGVWWFHAPPAPLT